MVTLKEKCKKLEAQYASVEIEGKRYTHYSKSSVNEEIQIPKGAIVMYKKKDSPWKEEA